MRGVIAALLGVFWTCPLAAQTWTREAGSAYVDASIGYVAGGSIYGPDFNKLTLATPYSQLVVASYAEVGLIDRWLTTTVAAEWLRRNQLAEQGRTTGLGDTRIGFWSGLVTEPFRLTVGLWLGIPTGDPQPSGNSPDTNLIARSLPTGDGEWDLEPQVRWGIGVSPTAWPFTHYAQAAVGYQVRTQTQVFGVAQDIADGVTYLIEFGAQPRQRGLDRLWLSAKLYGLESLASSSEAASGAVGLGNGVTYTAYQVRVYARLYDGLGVAASFESALRARSIVAAPVWRLAVSYQL